MDIPFVDLKTQYKNNKTEIDNAISTVISNSHFIQGEEVKLFEKEFSQYVNAQDCITVNSGTDALILGIKNLQLSTGDEIIIPANTFIATAIGATQNGLKPVFVDIDENDFGINLDDLKKKINSRTKAIIVVHLYGQPDKIDEIKKIIKNSRQKIYLIEDACQAHGALYKNKKVGNFGIFSAFSFYPGKNLGAYGDGGALIVNNSKLAKKLRLAREYGQKKKYYHDTLGVNSRLDTIQAAILRVKLKYLDIWNEKRKQAALMYSDNLKKLYPLVITPKIFRDRQSVYHLYVIRTKKRNQLIKYLNDRGIQALIHYPIPLHRQKAFSYLKYKKGDFPVTDMISDQIISLPIFPEIKKEQILFIVKSIYNFY
ncbi:MAG: Glutamine-scyllo-inositol transaminase [Candidatus Roizmanbacteria bacterium GW2011_GWA2_36_23]|uniref:Glutamine-scyllo-inositol transaminase n=1 Tax=Candidatus Roizmanbacteria bacterium GW2011_GWA2_36_23 TaxID=1618480 RepID=A0A0G0HCV6_9BACT|nr:MAG: Glutamine-scyllo-inositol transaminase [Candidatus Roizmanbacteria bacterium GW2011_GWA2_36_23]